MTNATSLGCSRDYYGCKGSASWEGRIVDDRAKFAEYMREVVQPRIADAESSFEADLRALATTGMATEFVERLLNAVPSPEGWEIGEALAECVLQSESDREVHWPWNTVRDRRTPRASLPGADLVGFYCEDDEVWLLFGEVKTSSDPDAPPGVMNGGSGMAWQIEQSATRLDLQHTLLKWLQARCKGNLYRDLYQKAVAKYLASRGKDLLLVGVLIRDTAPNERDLRPRGEALAARLPEPTY